MHVSKCNLECEKVDCGYKLSQGAEMNFKYFCIGQDKYFEHYEGQWRDAPKVSESCVEVKIEANEEGLSEESNSN